MNRRDFLLRVSGAAGGLALAVEIPFAPYAAAAAPASDGVFRPDAWLRIAPDNTLTFVLDRVEMGQGTMSSLAKIVAEELGVDAEDLVVEFAPASRAYLNPNLKIQMTGGSTSVATSWAPLRHAGATARALLVEAAAKRWGVAVDACATKQKSVYLISGGKSATYGELAAAAADLPVPDAVKLKDPKDFRLIGKTAVRLDAALKSTGRAGFGIDVTLPDLRVAVVKRCPVFGGKVKSFDAARVKAMPGVEAVLEIPSGVAVVAKRFWQAKAAAEALTVAWDLEGAPAPCSVTIMESFAAAAKEALGTLVGKGRLPEVFRDAAKTVSAEYRVPYLAHAAMEPGNCTAHVTAEACDIWAPTQGPGLAQQLACEITGLPHEKVRIHTTFLGGGFGRRLYQDFVVEAVHLAKLLPYPVKVQWTREDDMRHDFYRPATVHSLSAALDGTGRVVGWAQAVAGQSIVAQCMSEWLRAIVPEWLPEGVKSVSGAAASGLFTAFGQDPTASEGAEDLDYPVPELHVAYAAQKQPVPVGFWRSVGHSYTGFVVESFIDELAAAAGKDPLTFRRGLLKDQKKQLAVLDLAAEKAGWGAPLPAGVARGVAVHSAFGSCAAQVVEASVSGAGITVHRVVCAIDCGRVVDPGGVEAQIQGGIAFALSAALYGEITLKDGAVEQSNFHDYQVLRSTAMPKVEVYVVPSAAPPSGVGEPGVPPLAPALANALFTLTGKRLRSLPLRLG